MQQLIYFLKRYKFLLYFILLQFLAVALIINNHNFHKSKYVSSSNNITGSMIRKSSEISDYLDLKEQNKLLTTENNKLKNKLSFLNSKDSISEKTVIDTTYNQKFKYTNGVIRSNQFRRLHNYLMIDIGENDGIAKEMAVINDKGIIGIVDDISNNYSRVRSILNKNSHINARFKNNFYFGTLTWNGKNTNTVQLIDIPRQASYHKGDTIITGGKSLIFPEGIPIGIVANPHKKLSASNSIDIKLFNDMSNVKHIYVINSYEKEEFKILENKTNE